ncbi:diguanylate cyclase domain-containing protein [Halobacillus sp. Nhm2S1]|uniref:sensor domain-containing diguanylate cyclase n=1 Tax=Halobacillus sp. Nhm2S1 TaxID=2866716 RepID=UPI001C72FA3D|nr:diguanylate cyclase [Halobacillus sp. Nhm2S1]MBX0359054.1 diguanylate cyclase [Halobacillus sp. Nhm2S1]
MIVQSLIKKRLEKLQSLLFEFMTSESPYTFEQFVVNLTDEIKSFSHSSVCAIYLLDEWKGRFQLYSKGGAAEESLRIHFSLDDLHNQKTSEPDVHQLIDAKSVGSSLRITSLYSEGTVFGYLVLKGASSVQIEDGFLGAIGLEVTKCIKKIEGFYMSMEEEKKYELLYKVTSHFHSSIDTDGVLIEIIETLRKTYPDFQYYLLLSNDYTKDNDLPVRELTYDMDLESSASTQAYLTGEVQIEDHLGEKRSILYAPLKGKQGIYGVLKVVTPDYLYFPKKDVEFFIFIANTAGKALENAQLYQQSRKLNSDLQLINSTSQKLNSNMRLTEKIRYMAYKIQQSFHADEVGFVTYEELSSHNVLEGSTEYFTSSESSALVHYVMESISHQEGPLFISDLEAKPIDHVLQYRSLMAVPMKDHEHISGLAIVLHKDPYFFTFESFKLLQSLVAHSTLAFANSILREELEKAVITDYLTKLHSRVHLDRCVEQHVKHDENGSLILFDIDNFKNINDTYGHQVGDEVICQVADIIKTVIGDQGLSARWGGEELAVYIPVLPSEKAHDLTEIIREKIALSTSPAVTVSCGIAPWRSEWLRPDRKQIVQQADQALYKAKSSGRNRIVTAHPIKEKG